SAESSARSPCARQSMSGRWPTAMSSPTRNPWTFSSPSPPEPVMVDGHGRRSPPPPRAARVLLSGIVDYAGLFPPAALTMWSAVQNYAAYRSGVDAWALGRFVAPAVRLHELATAIAGLDPEGTFAGWRV